MYIALPTQKRGVTGKTELTLGWWMLRTVNGVRIACHVHTEEVIKGTVISNDGSYLYTKVVHAALYYLEYPESEKDMIPKVTISAVYHSPVEWYTGWSAEPMGELGPEDTATITRIKMGIT